MQQCITKAFPNRFLKSLLLGLEDQLVRVIRCLLVHLHLRRLRDHTPFLHVLFDHRQRHAVRDPLLTEASIEALRIRCDVELRNHTIIEHVSRKELNDKTKTNIIQRTLQAQAKTNIN